MRDLTPDTICDAFARHAADASSPRLRQLLVSLASHLHQFVRDNHVNHQEWRTALEVMTRAGTISTAERNEFVLFSDLLGISSLVDMINSPEGATSSSVLGPFHRPGAPLLAQGGDLGRGQPGEALLVTGRIVDAQSGVPVAAMLDIWQNADNGFYAAQDLAQPDFNYHARMDCPAGVFCFTTTMPRPYPVPTDGPAGDMLRALGRDAMRPAHLHFIATADSFSQLVTEMFVAGDPYLGSDATFGVRADLVMNLREDGTAPDGLAATLPKNFRHADLTFKLARRKT